MVDVGDDTDFVVTSACELDGGFDFGEHRAGLEVAVFDEVFELSRGDAVDGLLAG